MDDWNALVRDHREAIFGIAWRVLGHAQDAEDVVQDVFAQASRQSDGQPIVSWPALLRRMATYRAIDTLRRRRNAIPLDCVDLTAAEDDPQAIVAGHELEARLRAALAEIPPRDAEVFCLRYFEELSYREIAETLGMSTSAVSTALHQARSRLENMLTEPEE